MAGAAQVSWARWPVGWGGIEPTRTTPAHYTWTGTDASLLAASAAGIRVIGTIDGNPAWAAQFPSGPIDRAGNAAFVGFVGELVERYDGDGRLDAPGSPIVDYWEFYNEPDNGDELAAQYGGSIWGDHGAEYARLLCDAYPAIKLASPNAKIVLGGLAYDYFEEEGGVFVRRFLDDVLVAGGGRCLDFMNFHYYPFFESRWMPYGPGLSGKANYLRSKLASYGFGSLPFVITEAGHHSNAYPEQPSTPEIQSAYVVKLFTQAISSNIQTMIWFSWYDLSGYWAATGLLTTSLEPKPSYTAFRVARNKLGASQFQRRLTTAEVGSSDVEAYLFRKSNPIYVVWVDGAAVRQVKCQAVRPELAIPSIQRSPIFWMQMMGETDGMITVTSQFIAYLRGDHRAMKSTALVPREHMRHAWATAFMVICCLSLVSGRQVISAQGNDGTRSGQQTSLQTRKLYLPLVMANYVPPEGRLCRFGVGAPSDIARYPVNQLRIGWYTDWGARLHPDRPGGIDYLQMVRLSQPQYGVDSYTSVPSGQRTTGHYRGQSGRTLGHRQRARPPVRSR